MPVQKFDALDAIPEELRETAIEAKDGTFVVVTDDAAELKDALAKQRDIAAATEKLNKKLAKELADLQVQVKAKEAGLNGEQIQKLRDEVRADLEAEYRPKLELGERALAENRTLLLDNQVRDQLAKAGFLPERIEKVWKLHGSDFDLTDDRKPVVKANPGVPVEKYVAETLAKAYPEWVRGTQAGGGGAAGTKPSSTAVAGTIDPVKDPVAALTAAREQGLAA